ncbi:MAG: septation protein A [Candidatus Muproteobacteria bacterium RBG_16_64_11]|uniref:Inner membrane-spanning protein YciB n=1 Tax=Candidatus Muproteobacteria bacterium RBG_16_64_11 TaxID=1817758 RepID=A0A1F6T9X2_9PROT|nr:MAG: septation protein A [Candidatus Muproteobacteria bacterium RBG_16_64_11]
MKFLFDLFPLLLFFAAFKLFDIYIATGVAIVASFAQVGIFWLKHRRFETIHLITLAVIVIFGGLTLALRDDTFIRWKPTIVYWLLGALILGSHMIGKKTAIEHLLGAKIKLPARVWSQYNLSWGVFFLLMGALNIYVAFYYGLDLDDTERREIWVNFKVFGLLGLTLAFTVVQAMFLAKYIDPGEKGKS